MTFNAHNEYGTYFIETEALVALREDDADYAHLVLAQMSASQRRAFRRQLFRLYWIAGQGLSSVEDIEEMMGELMMIANNMAPT